MRADAMAVVENWIHSGIKLDAIVANNDEMAVGAIQALLAANIKDMLVAGIDATSDALDYIESGNLTITLFQNVKAQGQTAVDSAIKLVNGEETKKMILIPFEVVDSSNFKDFQAFWASVNEKK
jgi:inositol transport system substrate-binding protein